MIHIVLYQPEIPQNTGNIIRSCAATGAELHLIEPLGFRLDAKTLKRTSVQHVEDVGVSVYPDWDSFRQTHPGPWIFLTRYGKKSHDQARMSDPHAHIYLIFGKESTGIPKSILRPHLDQCYRIPMKSSMRSLNLANAVAIVLYEALRQQHFPELSLTEPEIQKGADWLSQDD
ncbi:MAG: tRNA (cytidine(34)-2'-O)-methyltransferase [Candidatus Izemoplasmatales bacterium]|jgi:tRNA (cytidine/uridine-2'-O-)-methyltransferase